MQDSTFAEFISNDMRVDNLGQVFFLIHINPPLPPVDGTYQAYLIQFPNGFRKWTNGKDLQIYWPAPLQQPPNTPYSENAYGSSQYPTLQKQLPAVFESFHYSAGVLVGNCIPGAASNVATVYDYCGLAGGFRVIARAGEANVHWDVAGGKNDEVGITRPEGDKMIGGFDGWDGMEETSFESNRLGTTMDTASVERMTMTKANESVENQTCDILKPTQMEFAPREEYTEFTQFVDLDGLCSPSSRPATPPQDQIIAPKPLRCTISKLLTIPESEPFELPELVFDTPEPETVNPAFDIPLHPHYSPGCAPNLDPFMTPEQMDTDLDFAPLLDFNYPAQDDWSISGQPMNDFGVDGQEDSKGTYAPCVIPGLGSVDMDDWGWTIGTEIQGDH